MWIFLFFFFFDLTQDGRPDRSFFAADCFHLSQKSQGLMARALWNNMVRFTQMFLLKQY